MKDYFLEIKIKNNHLLSRMQNNGIYTLVELSKLSNVPYGSIVNLSNLKESIYQKNGGFYKHIVNLAKFFNCNELDLVPVQHIYKGLERNKATAEVDLIDLEQITSRPSEFSLLENYSNKECNKNINEILKDFNEREQYIIKARFGIDGVEEKTYRAIGKELGVTQERIRQIEGRVIRLMKHPSRASILRSFLTP